MSQTPHTLLKSKTDSNPEANRSILIVGSLESLASTIYSWQKNTRAVRPPVVLHGQTGREVLPHSFFMCFMAFLLLSAGSGFSVVSLWSLLWKSSYEFIFPHLEFGYFGFPAGLLCLPCFLVATAVHTNEKNYVFLPLLMVLLLISSILLVTCIWLGIRYRTQVTFVKDGNRENILTNEYLTRQVELNMLTYFNKTDNPLYRDHWDKIQTRLKCCGIYNSSDFGVKSIPETCCSKLPCKAEVAYKNGCLKRLFHSTAWDASFFIGLSSILVAIEISSQIYSMVYYFLERHKQN